MHDTENPLAAADRALTPVENLANMIAAFAILALMCLGVAQIVLRSVFNAPVTGYIDLVELSMATMAFLGAAYCQRLGAHIRMEMLIGRLHGRALWLAEAFGLLVALFIIGVLVWHGWAHFLRSYTLGDTTIDAEYPVWPSKLLVPVAFGLWWLRLAVQFLGAVRLAIDPTREPVGVVLMKDVAHHAQDEITEIMGEGEGADEGAGGEDAGERGP